MAFTASSLGLSALELGCFVLDEGSLTVKMERMTRASCISIVQYLRQVQPLIDLGLRISAGLQSNDVGLDIPELRSVLLTAISEAIARTPQRLNLIKSDLSLSCWQLADKAIADGDWPATARSGTSLGSAHRAILQDLGPVP